MTSSLLAASVAAALAASPAPERHYVQSRSGNTAVAQLFADGFEKLAPNDKHVAWELAMAAHAGEPIQYDQLGWHALEMKRLLESVYLFGLEGKPGSRFDARLADFLRRFYGNLGNHDSTTGQKFVPAFTPAELSAAAHRALAAGAPLGVADGAALDRWLAALRPSLFDPAFDAQTTSKSPPPGKDLLTASANTFYGPGVTLKDLQGFDEKHPLDSRVVKQEGKLVEEVYRAGTADGSVPPGLYAEELSRVNQHLDLARHFAAAGQQDALSKLIRYFQTGDLGDWAAYEIAWLKADPAVDGDIGFIETYADARGAKGAWEALIHFKDPQDQKLMELLAGKAQYFEDKMPWPDEYKRRQVSPPVAKAVDFVDTYPQPPGGINLPNEQDIRQKYGSKSILVSNVMETASAVRRMPLAVEFSATLEERKDAEKYSVPSRKILVAFHEVTGHGSGQVAPALKGDPSVYLKEYYNTLEEARADLVALWQAFDPALKELYPDFEQLGRQTYRDFLTDGLTQLARVEKGEALEEDHQRGHQMTVQFLIGKGAARVKRVPQPKGSALPVKTYYEVTDFPKMREAAGELLTKLMVIKATGDYAGIQELVTKLGVKFDPKLRDEVVARVKAADVPAVVFLSSPRLAPVVAPDGTLADLKVETDQDFILQNLERTVLGHLPPDEALKVAAAGASLQNLRAEFKKLGGHAVPPPGAPGKP